MVFDLVYIAAMMLKTRLAFYQNGALVIDPKKIWNKYRTSMDFFVDAFSILPFDWLLLMAGHPVHAFVFRLIQFFFLRGPLPERASRPVRVSQRHAIRLGSQHYCIS
jgi:hypothetical protein